LTTLLAVAHDRQVTDRQGSNPREVALVAFDGVQTLDLAGPLEVFAGANRLEEHAGRPAPYRVSIVGVRTGLVRTESGLGLLAESGLPAHQVDTIVVPGGEGAQHARHDERLLDWLRAAIGARRVCSVCTGAFVLAQAGLLDGRRATTHWSRARQLAREFPEVRVDAAPLFIRDGQIWTSAGVTAGIDLALALVEADLGTMAAQTIARWLVLFLRRSGGQSQFAAEVWTDPPERDVLARVVRAVHAEPGGDHRLAALAERAQMSERHLQRCFRVELGTSPAAFVTRVRVDAARRLLEQEDATVEATARRVGFGTAETMRRAFQAQLGVPPDTYRDRFTATKLAPH
jgi:transcriptional regulator GlxA family with amidase domain